MKKALSLVLTMCMVLSLFATFVISASAEATNVALNKEYTITGCGMGYENLSGQWPSSYTAKLTDGAAHEELTFGETKNWFAFYYNDGAAENLISAPGGTGAAVIDLGSVVNGVNKFRVHLGNHHANGVADPVSFSVYYSVDGVEYTKAGDFELKDSAVSENAVLAYWSEVTLDTAVSARYVKFEVVLTGVFAFLNELEVYADPSAAAPVEDKVINLLAQPGTVAVGNLEANDLEYTLDENGFTATCLGTKWPNVTLNFDEALLVDVEGAYIEFEATVEGGNGASIRIKGPVDESGFGPTDDIYLHQFGHNIPLDTSGDIPSGNTISYKLPLSEMAFCNYNSDVGYAGKVAFGADQISFNAVFICVSGNGATATIKKLNLVIPGEASNAVKETIAVDGDVNDTGWAKKGWINVSGENGSWQYPTKKEVAEGAVIPTFTYKFQLRADDTKLYGALVLDGVHEEDKNIKVRVWFRDNDEATVYSSFYDFVLAPDGTLETAAKYNTSTTENKGAAIEPTTLEAVAKVVDGKTVFEFSVNVDEVTADGNFDYFVCLERKQGVNTGTLYYPFVPELNETSPHGNYPWLLWYAENDATVEVEDIVLGEIVVSDKEEADTSMMGTAPADPAFTVTLATEDGWKAGEKL
ncbi:MAG: discoidin domain-containing protein, partial [Clostridia bacterium]|nr:discoidin domain-containing protein [Clostridia bacterium]